MEPIRGQRDLLALERKVRAAGRVWRVDDALMVVDGQWAVPAHREQPVQPEQAAAQAPAAPEWVDLTAEELIRLAGIQDDTDRDGRGD